MKPQSQSQTPPSSRAPATMKDTGGPIRTAAVLLTLIGLIIMLVAVFADQLDIGGGKGFGWKQLIAAIVGLVMILIGIAWFLQPPATPITDDLDDTEPPPRDRPEQQAPQDRP